MINIALLGFGTIGSGVAEVVAHNAELIKKRTGEEINIKYIVDLRDFSGHPLAAKFTKDFKTVVNDPEVSVVAEMIGGSHPAYDFTLSALRAGKNVVTSNKEVVSRFGDELLREASAHGVRYLFEASVGGGIPLIRPMQNSFAGSEILEIAGILNGTTNYILTRLTEDAAEKKGLDMAAALREAQEKGYAEANPSADIDGVDACRKICILAAIAFGKLIDPDKVKIKGISGVTTEDIRSAAARKAVIKLIGRAVKLDDGRIYISVDPCEVSCGNPLSGVKGVYNGILLRGRDVGDVMFYGRGAGSIPTASAVLADIMDIVTRMPVQPAQTQWLRGDELYTAEAPEADGFRKL